MPVYRSSDGWISPSVSTHPILDTFSEAPSERLHNVSYKSRALYILLRLDAVYWDHTGCGWFFATMYTFLVDFLFIVDFFVLISYSFRPSLHNRFVIATFCIYQFFLYSTRVCMWYSLNCDRKFRRGLRIVGDQLDIGVVRLNRFWVHTFLIFCIPLLGALASPILILQGWAKPDEHFDWMCCVVNSLTVFYINFGFLLWSYVVLLLSAFYVQFLSSVLDQETSAFVDPTITFAEYERVLARIQDTNSTLSFGVNCRALFGLSAFLFSLSYDGNLNPLDRINVDVTNQLNTDFTMAVFLLSLIIEHYALRQINYLCEQVEERLCRSSHDPEFKLEELMIHVKVLGARVRSQSYMQVLGFPVNHVIVAIPILLTLTLVGMKIHEVVDLDT